MRVFVSINPPAEVRRAALEAAEEKAQDLAGGVKWIKPENVHVTLKFLGEVPDEALGGIRDALGKVCSAHAPFDARLRGLGAFPSMRRARVVWAGMDEGSKETSALAASVEAALEPLGFRQEGRRYVPHATLGRARGGPVGIDTFGEGALETPSFGVTSAELTRSTPTPRGSVYEILEAFTLRGTGR